MAARVKIFQTNPYQTGGPIATELEQSINEWLEANPALRIVHAQTCALPPSTTESQPAGTVLCMVFYVDSRTDGDRRAGFLRD
ncbi:MAG: hypothetical protein SFU56_00855 [Capsulimonadales bacterium]|nr:hypothetical protein [Capsulimonadales bacterium]